MESKLDTPLLASDGATFNGLVSEAWNGWRASALLQLKKVGSEMEEQIVGPLTFERRDAAKRWLQQVGRDHGFDSVDIVVRFRSEAEKKDDPPVER